MAIILQLIQQERLVALKILIETLIDPVTLIAQSDFSAGDTMDRSGGLQRALIAKDMTAKSARVLPDPPSELSIAIVALIRFIFFTVHLFVDRFILLTLLVT